MNLNVSFCITEIFPTVNLTDDFILRIGIKNKNVRSEIKYPYDEIYNFTFPYTGQEFVFEVELLKKTLAKVSNNSKILQKDLKLQTSKNYFKNFLIAKGNTVISSNLIENKTYDKRKLIVLKVDNDAKLKSYNKNNFMNYSGYRIYFDFAFELKELMKKSNSMKEILFATDKSICTMRSFNSKKILKKNKSIFSAKSLNSNSNSLTKIKKLENLGNINSKINSSNISNISDHFEGIERINTDRILKEEDVLLSKRSKIEDNNTINNTYIYEMNNIQNSSKLLYKSKSGIRKSKKIIISDNNDNIFSDIIPDDFNIKINDSELSKIKDKRNNQNNQVVDNDKNINTTHYSIISQNSNLEKSFFNKSASNSLKRINKYTSEKKLVKNDLFINNSVYSNNSFHDLSIMFIDNVNRKIKEKKLPANINKAYMYCIEKTKKLIQPFEFQNKYLNKLTKRGRNVSLKKRNDDKNILENEMIDYCSNSRDFSNKINRILKKEEELTKKEKSLKRIANFSKTKNSKVKMNKKRYSNIDCNINEEEPFYEEYLSLNPSIKKKVEEMEKSKFIFNRKNNSNTSLSYKTLFSNRSFEFRKRKMINASQKSTKKYLSKLRKYRKKKEKILKKIEENKRKLYVNIYKLKKKNQNEESSFYDEEDSLDSDVSEKEEKESQVFRSKIELNSKKNNIKIEENQSPKKNVENKNNESNSYNENISRKSNSINSNNRDNSYDKVNKDSRNSLVHNYSQYSKRNQSEKYRVSNTYKRLKFLEHEYKQLNTISDIKYAVSKFKEEASNLLYGTRYSILSNSINKTDNKSEAEIKSNISDEIKSFSPVKGENMYKTKFNQIKKMFSTIFERLIPAYQKDKDHLVNIIKLQRKEFIHNHYTVLNENNKFAKILHKEEMDLIDVNQHKIDNLKSDSIQSAINNSSQKIKVCKNLVTKNLSDDDINNEIKKNKITSLMRSKYIKKMLLGILIKNIDNISYTKSQLNTLEYLAEKYQFAFEEEANNDILINPDNSSRKQGNNLNKNLKTDKFLQTHSKSLKYLNKKNSDKNFKENLLKTSPIRSIKTEESKTNISSSSLEKNKFSKKVPETKKGFRFSLKKDRINTEKQENPQNRKTVNDNLEKKKTQMEKVKKENNRIITNKIKENNTHFSGKVSKHIISENVIHEDKIELETETDNKKKLNNELDNYYNSKLNESSGILNNDKIIKIDYANDIDNHYSGKLYSSNNSFQDIDKLKNDLTENKLNLKRTNTQGTNLKTTNTNKKITIQNERKIINKNNSMQKINDSINNKFKGNVVKKYSIKSNLKNEKETFTTDKFDKKNENIKTKTFNDKFEIKKTENKINEKVNKPNTIKKSSVEKLK